METFVLRIWVGSRDRPTHGPLRGVVEHVRTGSSVAFRSVRELAAYLEATTGRATGSAAATKGTPR
jgi:hypothetical protein